MNPRENRLRIARLRATKTQPNSTYSGSGVSAKLPGGSGSPRSTGGRPVGHTATQKAAPRERKDVAPSGRRARPRLHARHGTRQFDL